MEQKYFYVYKWFNTETNEIFYIGKGCRNRYKETARRNQDFLEYYNTHPCTSEIIEYFDTEEEAFKKEAELIKQYRSLGQAQANLDDGGKGGCHFVWTDQMKDYFSRNNPMKRPEQKERMSKNNPMKDPEVAKKVAKQNQNPIMINGVLYDSVNLAAQSLQVSQITITNWCQRGHDSKGNICYYVNPQKKTHRRTDRAVIIDDITFDTITDAAIYLDCKPSNLGSALRAGKTTYKKHKCRYADQQPS